MQAHETMAEVPKQFMSYMEKNKIVPNLPVDRPIDDQVAAPSTVTQLTKPHLPGETGLPVPSSVSSHLNQIPTLIPEMTAPPYPGTPPYSLASWQPQPAVPPPYSVHTNGNYHLGAVKYD